MDNRIFTDSFLDQLINIYMTREEHALKDLEEFKSKYPNREVFPYCIERIDKFKWHDLRKNSKDLPQENGMYLTYSEWIEDFECANTTKGYTIIEFYFGAWCAPKYSRIIAWKKIEEFENYK